MMEALILLSKNKTKVELQVSTGLLFMGTVYDVGLGIVSFKSDDNEDIIICLDSIISIREIK